MSFRSDTQYPATSVGTIAGTVNASVTFSGSGYARRDDYVLPGNGHNFYVNKCTFKTGGIANGLHSGWTLSNFMLEAFRDPRALYRFADETGLGLLPPSVATAKLLAETNPSRASVDLPIFFAELRELPDLVKNRGRDLLDRLASANLNYQFGIKPLISDLTSLLNFSDAVDKRFKELNALARGGIRRKRNLATGSTNLSDILVTQSAYFLTAGERTEVFQGRQWGFVKWVPDGIYPRTDADRLRDARRAVLGLTLDGSTAWNLIPWTWLADWFSNIGDILEANRNLVGAHPEVVLLMFEQTQEVSVSCESLNTGLVKCQNFKVRYTTKLRSRETSPTITAYLPCLSASQIGILASLVALRTERY